MPGTVCNKGFTLIELLLAIAISGFVAIVGYQGLSVAIDASAGVENESQRLAEIQLALGILEDDISQIIARPVRTELGGIDPIMSGGLSNESLLLFTRQGWDNPRMTRRSELARINYQWQGQRLIRQRWSTIDRISLEDGLDENVLLEGVDDFQVEFFTPFINSENNSSNNQQAAISNPEGSLAGQWVDYWSSERLGLNYDQPLPPAVRISFTINGFGRISRVISIVSA